MRPVDAMVPLFAYGTSPIAKNMISTTGGAVRHHWHMRGNEGTGMGLYGEREHRYAGLAAIRIDKGWEESFQHYGRPYAHVLNNA